jgi:hypothetical protein
VKLPLVLAALIACRRSGAALNAVEAREKTGHDSLKRIGFALSRIREASRTADRAENCTAA